MHEHNSRWQGSLGAIWRLAVMIGGEGKSSLLNTDKLTSFSPSPPDARVLVHKAEE